MMSEMQYAMADAKDAAKRTRQPHAIAYVEDPDTGALFWDVFPVPPTAKDSDYQFVARA